MKLPEPKNITEQKWNKSIPPLVSISCITYNQEIYIAKAIEGFLKQKTTFKVEILIHDDSSTDSTAKIVRSFELKYPQLIKVIYQKENTRSKGIRARYSVQLNQAKGKFYALCDGDDYWTDPYKLQKQVDFLEANPDYGMVYSDVNLYLNKRKKKIKNLKKRDFKVIPEGKIYEDLLITNFINTCTVCIKSEILNQIDKKKLWVESPWIYGDYPLWLEISLISKIGYIKEATATYRILEESAAHTKDYEEKLKIYKNGYDMRNYYIKKYGCSERTIKIINYRYNKGLLKFAFFLKDRHLAQKSFTFLKNNKHKKLTINFKDKFYYFGTKSILKIILHSIYFIQLKIKLFVESVHMRLS